VRFDKRTVRSKAGVTCGQLPWDCQGQMLLPNLYLLVCQSTNDMGEKVTCFATASGSPNTHLDTPAVSSESVTEQRSSELQRAEDIGSLAGSPIEPSVKAAVKVRGLVKVRAGMSSAALSYSIIYTTN
jgi:hypothetical protein